MKPVRLVGEPALKDLAQLFSANVVGVIRANIHGRIVDANDYFLDLLGYSRDDLPISWKALTPPEWGERDQEKILELEQSGTLSPFVKEYLTRDGQRLPVLLTGVMTDAARGQVLGVVIDQREAQRTLKASENRFRDLYENLPLMYFALTAEGIIRSVNFQGADQLGYKPEELIGTSVLEVFDREDRPRVAERFRESIAKPGDVAQWQFRKRRKDGTMLWVDEIVRAVMGPDGELEVLVICEDVTARRNADRALREQKRRLEHLASALTSAEERERRRIASGLHDDIGQVLALAKLQLGQLAEVGAETDRRPLIHEIESLVARAAAATRSLTFELSSPLLYELGLVAALQDLSERVAARSGIRVRFETEGCDSEPDRELAISIFRIVRELLRNLTRHASASDASVQLRGQNGSLGIIVEDDGIGFDREAVWDHVGDTPAFGLFSIREEVERNGGILKIDTAPGRGTRVEIELPKKEGRR